MLFVSMMFSGGGTIFIHKRKKGIYIYIYVHAQTSRFMHMYTLVYGATLCSPLLGRLYAERNGCQGAELAARKLTSNADFSAPAGMAKIGSWGCSKPRASPGLHTKDRMVESLGILGLAGLSNDVGYETGIAAARYFWHKACLGFPQTSRPRQGLQRRLAVKAV